MNGKLRRLTAAFRAPQVATADLQELLDKLECSSAQLNAATAELERERIRAKAADESRRLYITMLASTERDQERPA